MKAPQSCVSWRSGMDDQSSARTVSVFISTIGTWLFRQLNTWHMNAYVHTHATRSATWDVALT